MQVFNTSEEQIIDALAEANKAYAGNLKFRASAYQTPSFQRSGKALLVTLGVRDARAPGHRVGYGHLLRPGAKPKRLRYACWHAHRDFLQALFTLAPTTRVKTALADYQGAAEFERLFPATGEARVTAAGHTICDLCACGDPTEGA